MTEPQDIYDKLNNSFNLDDVARYDANQAEIFRVIVKRIRHIVPGGREADLDGLVEIVRSLVVNSKDLLLSTVNDHWLQAQQKLDAAKAELASIKGQEPVAGFICSKADRSTRFSFATTLPALLEYEAEGFKTERLYLAAGAQPELFKCNGCGRRGTQSELEATDDSECDCWKHLERVLPSAAAPVQAQERKQFAGFEDWWKESKPAECDEVEAVFRECWQIAQERKPLTESEIEKAAGISADYWKIVKSTTIQFARAIEAAHGIKEQS
jgi:hypothetical protein